MDSYIKESPIMSYSANPESSIMDSYINQQKKKSGGTSFIHSYSCKQEDLFICAFTCVNGGVESDGKESDRKGHFLPIFSPLWK
jgi:hypothetical protein